MDGYRLQRARKRAALTQEQVASTIGVSREMVSMWENGTRTPKPKMLSRLADLYGTATQFLKGEGSEDETRNRKVLFRIGDYSPGTRDEAREEVERWTGFLNNWANFLETTDVIESGAIHPGRPPKEIDEGFGITDARRASTLARKVRDHYGLGQDAIPDLYSFLDDAGVLVYKASLDPVSESQETVSGAFYNHHQVGYSILVNVQCSEGRQAFTLAHEFAHALFHYPSQALVSVSGDDDPRERFANAFAAYFLVPPKRLRKLCRKERNRRDSLSPFSALRFAAYFRVSYLMMLFRLNEERQISQDEVTEWKDYSPTRMAKRIGLDPDFLMSPERRSGLTNRDGLWRYPISVVERIQEALQTESISAESAVQILQVDMGPDELRRELLDIPEREGEEDEENLDEYPIRWRAIN
jgi:Zn-dependent peptidase ImmA (M78 family)/transcriptional regulator with XRE-family HTH domain